MEGEDDSVGISNAILKIVTFLIVSFLIVLCRIDSVNSNVACLQQVSPTFVLFILNSTDSVFEFDVMAVMGRE